MTVPEYWLPRPPVNADEATDEAVSAFLAGNLNLADLPRGVVPWHFLCALAARRKIAFHGTGDGGIERFEPREPVDFAPFGQQRAVFATSDPIWAMFYAIVDRAGHELTLNNGCLVLDDLGESYYYFSVSRQTLDRQPWRTGYLYLLAANTFVEQPAATYAGHPAHIPQLASPVAVEPFARLRVTPEDFPFLDRIGGHDDHRLAEYAQAVMSAAPWPD